jgi:hypothetical protein
MSKGVLNQRIAHLQMPDRLRHLPISAEGYPVPWFVAWIDGVPDFRIVDTDKLVRAAKYHKCMLCGEPLGRFKTFTIGPMCAVNRTSSEPPSHHDCASYAATACPFLTQPRMRRNEKDLPEQRREPAGIMLRRNPGVTLLWTCVSYKPFRDSDGGVLFRVGDPWNIEFMCQGRTATRAEILESMDSGLPSLMAEAEAEGPDAIAALKQRYSQVLLELVPPS